MFEIHPPAAYLALRILAVVVGAGFALGAIIVNAINGLHRK